MVFYSDPSFADGIAYVYLNGQLIGTTFYFNSTKVDAGVAWDAMQTYVQGIRFNVNKTQTYAWEWIEKGKIRWRELESHPLFVPVNGGSVVSAKVI